MTSNAAHLLSQKEKVQELNEQLTKYKTEVATLLSMRPNIVAKNNSDVLKRFDEHVETIQQTINQTESTVTILNDLVTMIEQGDAIFGDADINK